MRDLMAGPLEMFKKGEIDISAHAPGLWEDLLEPDIRRTSACSNWTVKQANLVRKCPIIGSSVTFFE
ncbi:hypothetical protein A6X21_11700 [Planctopirus hydrillae]|uniref:Uncharacterized protein n=1 Tax=Planctopirus hydrillae TaxID=1841610 RepID=A0A1C3E571_9PLAN|nr:hypothetical protein A6X21_11700 [Planctopirus hydrillae]